MFFLAEQYKAAGQFDKAGKLLEKAFAQNPTEQVCNSLIDLYQKTNDTEPLLNVLAQVAEKSNSLLVVEDAVQAILKDDVLLKKLLEFAQTKHAAASEDDFAALRVAGLMAAEAKQWQDVEKLFDLAIKANPKSAAELLLVWGLGLLMDNKASQAEEVFQRGIDQKVLVDDNPAFYYYLAGAWKCKARPKTP